MENHPTPSRKPPAFRRPAIKLDEAESKSDSSSSDAPDGGLFRKPMAPIQMTISPGNAANETKLAEKLKKLELSRKKTFRSQPIDLKTPSKVDLVATERLFVKSTVENIAQTPRNQSLREPLRTPSRLTQNVSMMDPRDSMRSNATYVLTTPRIDRALHPHNDPFTPSMTTPSRKTTTVSTPLAYDEKLERQFVALSSWANVILDSASFVSEIDLGTSKQDASRKLQEMLTKTSKKSGVTSEGTTRRYTDLCLRKKCLDYLKRADSVYQSTPIPGMLKAMVERGEISIKPNVDVYANIGVQTSILSLLFSLHPFWLFIGVETVCAEFRDHDTVSLDARLPFSSSSFAPATVKFIHDHILANAKLMSKKKFAIGTVRKIVTEKGREMLHKHCITCILSMAVLLEYAKNSYLFENTPGLFVKNSEIKTVTDFCTELSRLVLSASGTPLNKAFDKSSFRRTYRQSFLEEYQYAMMSVRDMADGIILGRLIELLTDSSPLSIIGNMRNPQGDRIRKKGNVEKALSAAAEAGIDVDGISIDQILSAHRESCLDLMWRLVGVYVKKKAEQEPLRRESLCLEGGTDCEDGDETVLMGAPLGGMAESAFAVYQQLAFTFGLTLSKWADLEDGLLLSHIWQHYNPAAPDVRFYEGESLFDKVANAADTDLGIPMALTTLRDERQLGLFAHMFLTRLISYKRLRDSEMSDGDSDASSIVSIIWKEGVNLREETERIERVRVVSERATSAKEEEKRREEEEEEREEAARVEAERVKREEEERLAEEQRMREERRRIEEEERERKEKEEEERMRREEETRIEEERLRKEEEERERLRLIEEACLKAEEEERERIEGEERVRIIEESRLKAEEEERLRREEEERLRLRLVEEARIRAEEEERLRREKEEEERRERAALAMQCWTRRQWAVRVVDGLRREKREEEQRIRREREEEEEQRRDKAALTIQCWTRQVYAVRLSRTLRRERDERLQREEEERREHAAMRITSWICDRLAIRAARKELKERKMKKEEEERQRMEEEVRRKKAVERIEWWFSSVLSIRAARSLLNQLREEREWKKEEARIERERMEEEQRMRLEEEARRVFLQRETAAITIQTHYRGWRLMVEAKEELERRRQREEEARLEKLRVRREEEERQRREEEARIERERLRREEEEEENFRRQEEERIRKERESRLEIERSIREAQERRRREEEEENIRGEAIRLELERIEREEEDKRLRDEEEARIELERQWKVEQERLEREEEDRLELERQLREEEQERLRREEAERVDKEERMKREEEKRREEEELKEWASKQRQAAHENEEKLFEEMTFAQERSRKLVEIRKNGAARTLQIAIRAWLHKRRMERRTVELLQRMDATPRNGTERMTIGSVSEHRLVAGMKEIKRRQRKLSLSLYRMTRLSNGEAATRIQAWWRGVVTRRKHRVQIELIGVRMREYNQRTDEVMEGDTRERAIPVSRRLERARIALENPQRLYDIKVACYTTMSLCRLSSLYCERAIVLGLPALLIRTFTDLADRSPAFEEIIEFGVQAIEEMVKCSTARVRVDIVANGADVARIAAHQMLAFYKNNVIVPSAIKILRLCKEILPVETQVETFEKMHTYYLKKGTEKFGKLPSDDIRNKEFVELKKAFSK